MRRLFIFSLIHFLLAFQGNADLWINDAEDITEEFLTETGSSIHYTEHVAHIKHIFQQMPVRTFIEFGVGFSTKFFIDNSEKVISVEFITPGSGPEWFQYCLELYRDYPNWHPIAYFSGPGLVKSWAPYKYEGADSVYHACAYQPAHLASYAPIDPSFLDDLDHFIALQATLEPLDVAFVDAGVCIRGDLVQLLFNKVPIIVAHDVAPKSRRHLQDVYGYGRVRHPENYVEIFVPFGMGTAFWIKNEEPYLTLIEDLKAYAASRS